MTKWKVRASRTLLHRPPWLHVEEQAVELPNGHIIEDYLLTPIPEVSMVFAVTSEKKILFVEQYKHGNGSMLWDLPAGYIDEEEDPYDCARRELEEETGYLADDWRPMGGWLIDPNRAKARMYFYLALNAQPDGQRHLDTTEDLVVHLVPLADVNAVLEDGRIQSLSSWAGVLAGLAALRRIHHT